MRVAPQAPDERPEATAEILAGTIQQPDGSVPNIFATIAHHPRLLKRWTAFGGVLLFRGELSGRDRELLIMRTAWNTRAHYEWDHHVDFARRSGISDDEIAKVVEGPDAEGWSAYEAALLKAADELHADSRISDPTWATLAAERTPSELVELCMVVGQYHLVAFTLRSLGVEPESDDFPVLPA
jgi:alkylhydroperoxidase family enzyme